MFLIPWSVVKLLCVTLSLVTLSTPTYQSALQPKEAFINPNLTLSFTVSGAVAEFCLTQLIRI